MRINSLAFVYSFSNHRPRVAAFGGGSTPFGQKPPNAFGTGNTFGTTPQATGAAGFGGGGGGAFGTNTATTGAFGQPAANNATASTSTFGAGGFGATNNSAWGKPAAQTGGFGGIAAGKLESHPLRQQLTSWIATNTSQGTANPPFSEVTERDSGAANVTLHYHSISCMPQYLKFSPEELRVQDYAVGRKNANSNVPAGPPAGGFGATTPATTGFGNTASTGGFGQPTATTGGFGAFGATNNPPTGTSGTGLFGASTTAANPGGFGGLGGTNAANNAFGQPAANTAANPFGSTTNPTGGFGAFGASTPTNTGFGANTNAAKPFGAFGT